MATIADLIMRQGEIAARGAERSGEIWGKAVQQLGQIGAGAFKEYAAQKEEKKRMAMFDDAMASFDPANPMDFYRKASVAVGPEVANQSIRAFAALAETQKRNQPDPKLFAEQVRFLKTMEKKSPGWLQAHWGQAFSALGPQAQALYGVQIGPEWSEEYRGMLDAFNPDDPTGQEYTLTPGSARFRGTEQIAAVPAAAPAPPKSLADLEAEAAARARGSASVRPPGGEGTWSDAVDAAGNPVLFNSKTGESKPYPTGIRPKPSAAETQDARKFKQAAPILNAVSELSEKINTLQGLAAKASGEAAKQAAKLNLNDNVAEYEALIQGFTPLVARALGHTGVLTQQDVDSVKSLFPRPGDSKSLRDRKVGRIKGIIGELESGAGGTSAATPADSGGEWTELPGGIKIRVKR